MTRHDRGLTLILLLACLFVLFPALAQEVTVGWIFPDDEAAPPNDKAYGLVGQEIGVGVSGTPVGGEYTLGPGTLTFIGDPAGSLSVKTSTPGTYTMTATYTYMADSDSDQSGDLVVFSGNVDVGGEDGDPDDPEDERPWDDDQEVTVGAFLPLSTPEEPYRAPVKLSVANDADLPEGKMRLLVTGGGDHIEIWSGPAGGELLYPNDHKPWEPDPLEFSAYIAKTVYMEPKSVTAVRDIELQLVVGANAGGEWQEWTADAAKATIVDVNLAARDLDHAEEYPLPEWEEENPGAYVHYNIDSDNGSIEGGLAPVADKDETDEVANENDLKKLVGSLLPASLEEGTVVLKRGGSAARVWDHPQKGDSSHQVLVDDNEKTWDLSNADQRAHWEANRDNLYVEGYEEDDSSLTLEFKDPYGNVICSDTVKYTFIGAVCGIRQPDWAERLEMHSSHPALVHCEWSIMEPERGEDPDPTYNCIAWSVDVDDEWYGAQYIDEEGGNGDGTLTVDDVDGFYSKKKDWSPITSGTPEQKALGAQAMYYPCRDAQGNPVDWNYRTDPKPPVGFHGARRWGCDCGAGRWIMYQSKDGRKMRIEHVWDQMNGMDDGEYGAPAYFYGL